MYLIFICHDVPSLTCTVGVVVGVILTDQGLLKRLPCSNPHLLCHVSITSLLQQSSPSVPCRHHISPAAILTFCAVSASHLFCSNPHLLCRVSITSLLQQSSPSVPCQHHVSPAAILTFCAVSASQLSGSPHLTRSALPANNAKQMVNFILEKKKRERK